MLSNKIDLRRHETVDKNGSGVRNEGRAEMVNVMMVEISRLRRIIDVGREGE